MHAGMAEFADEVEEGGLGGLFPSSSDDEDEEVDEIKYDTYQRPCGKEELSLALVKRHHSLWGEFIYNAARVVADYIDTGRIKIDKGCSVLELGAGAGLPGVICALNGAGVVVLSDYGSEFDRGLVKAMDINIEKFGDGCRMYSVPYIWGKAVEPLMVPSLRASPCATAAASSGSNGKGTEEVGKCFDVVIMADCIFNRSEHKQLIWTLLHTLDKSNPSAKCVCSFSHHDPQYTQEDLNFLELAKEAGLKCVCIGEEKRQSYPFVENDGMDERRGWVYVYLISWATHGAVTKTDGTAV